MGLDCGITHRLKKAQREMFRLAKHGHGFSQEAIHAASGIDRTSVGQYARGETAMGGAAIMALAAVEDFPAELLSLLFSGTGRLITNESNHDDGDLDALGCEAAGFTNDYVQARADGVVTPFERARLAERAARIAARASKVRAA